MVKLSDLAIHLFVSRYIKESETILYFFNQAWNIRTSHK